MGRRKNQQNYNVGKAQGGYSVREFDADVLDDTDLDGTTLTREPGMYGVSVVGTCSAYVGGATEVGMMLMGSNDGVNWLEIARSAVGEGFDAAGETRNLNPDTGLDFVDVGRYAFLRVDVFELVGTGQTFTVSVQVSGTTRDGITQVQTHAIAARTGDPTNGTLQARQRASRSVTAQAVLTGLNLGAGTAVEVRLQGTPDSGTTWVTLATAQFAANGDALLLQPGNGDEIDLGPYGHIRAQCADVGGALTAYVVNVFVSCDSCDYALSDPGGSQLSPALNASMVRVRSVADDSPQAAPGPVSVTFQLERFDGSPLLAQRYVQFAVGDTSHAGEGDLATNAIFSGVNLGAAVTPLNANTIVVLTDANGQVELEVTNAVAETVYAGAVDGAIEKLNPMVIVEAPETDLQTT